MSTEKLETLEAELLQTINAANDIKSLDTIRLSIFGKKGKISLLMKSLSAGDLEAKKKMGQALNKIKHSLQLAHQRRESELKSIELNNRLLKERIDITLPVRPEKNGFVHPISQTIDEIITIFGQMGFTVAEGPDIEDDWHNFTALNIPLDHPARQEHDTFYLSPSRPDDERMVLRTHTSPVQIRSMKNSKPPFKLIVPGRTYRCDHDSTHSPMFHQVEGLLIDKTTHMGHLKGCLIDFCREFFEIDDLPVRFRPSYFPFTEPSAEVDIGCTYNSGEFRIGHGGNWMEILGSGMVNPKVLENCGVDPSQHQGFAFGMGVERLAMLKYGISDLRTFYESDLRWLRHYGFSALNIPTFIREAVQ